MRWRQKGERERYLEREPRSHRDLEAEERQDAGLSLDQARYAAQRVLGNTALVQEEIRDMSRWMVLDTLRRNLHYAFRTLSRNRGFTAVAADSQSAAG
jgi:hypothetical protein